MLAGDLTLQELAVFLHEAELLVTVDTGPLHMAQASGCPVLAIFGPTDPVVWGPRGKGSRVIYHHKACSPCWGKGTCNQNACISDITAVEIMACDCRKPHPKMVNDACEDYAVDKAASFFIGDTDGDMQCARNAGVRGLRYKGGSLLKLVENNVK